MRLNALLASTTLLLLGGLPATAQVFVSPTSYNMPNGFSGSFNYWDENYTGSGNKTTDGAALSGGLGDLTDGILAADNWNIVEAPAGNGPYVGWTIDPLITFNFASPISFQTVQIHFDDSNGNGGVSAPASVSINGTNFLVTDPAGSAPFLQSFNVAPLNLTTSQLNIQLFRSNTWVFASEVRFITATASGVAPEPWSVSLLALGGLAFVRRRSRR
jgi:MYXO-CTERM domain-containing protein